MAKSKALAESRESPAPATVVQRRTEQPEKQVAPRRAMERRARSLLPPLYCGSLTDFLNFPGRGPGMTRSAKMLRTMQGMMGNARASRVIGGSMQAKLKVGAPDDRYAQEADRVEYEVMRKSAKKRLSADMASRRAVVPNKRPLCPVCEDAESGQIENPEDKRIQASSISDQSVEATQQLETYLHSSRWSGKPMPDSLRTSMERSFEQSFSGVRVHTDEGAARAAKSVSARAFTVGQNIYFGQGQYSPGTQTGKRLLAHELTHVAQQSDIARQDWGSLIQCYGFDQTSPSGDRLRVDINAEDPSGQVRPHASATIISNRQDSIPFNIRVNTVPGHRPIRVIVGIQVVTNGSTHTLRRQDLGDIQVLSGLFRIPQRRPGGIPPGAAPEFYIAMIPRVGEQIRYSHQLTYNEPAVLLARALSGEGGSTHQDMMALIHEVNNRMNESRLMGGQVDLSHPTWQENFIATTYLLGGGRAVLPPSWRRPPTSAARILAQQVLDAGGVTGADPTNGALFHYTTGTRLTRTGSPTGNLFEQVSWQVAHGMLAPVVLTNNTFYGCGPRAHTGAVRTLCRRP